MIIVTGGAGFIGSRLVKALANRGESTVIFEDKPHPEHIPWRGAVGWLLNRPSQISAVYHLGAITSTTETDEQRLFAHNVWFTHRLWSWCADNRVPFVYASSAATYGNGFWGFTEDLKKLELLEPLNAYGRSKHFADRTVLAKDEHGPRPPNWWGLKFFNVYGPGEQSKGDMRSLVSKLCDAALAGKPMQLFEGSDTFFRDFVHVDDVVDAMLWFMRTKPANGLYNVGSGIAASCGQIAEQVSQYLQGDATLDFISMPEGLRQQYQRRTQADISKLRAAGYDRPFRTVQQGVRGYLGAHAFA